MQQLSAALKAALLDIDARITPRVLIDLTEFYANGPIPPGLIVRHKCDNKPCCNPSHLETGTHTDNAHDRNKRGRANIAYGSQQGSAKLTEEAVLDIRYRYSAIGTTQQELADQHGISRSQISVIVNRKAWTHI